MLLRTWKGNGFLDAFREMDRLEKQMNRVFHGKSFFDVDEYPDINVYTREDSIMVRAFVPGVDPEKLDISVIGNTLAIRGSLPEEEKKDTNYLKRERNHGKFSRSIKLPFSAKSDGINAAYGKGILTVTVNRPEEDKPKHININFE